MNVNLSQEQIGRLMYMIEEFYYDPYYNLYDEKSEEDCILLKTLEKCLT